MPSCHDANGEKLDVTGIDGNVCTRIGDSLASVPRRSLQFPFLMTQDFIEISDQLMLSACQ